MELEIKNNDIITKDKVIEYLDAFGFSSQLSDKEKKQFIEIACAYQLNPFKREIYCIPYNTGNKKQLSIIVGYEVYLKRAERSGKLSGWNVKFQNENNELKAIITIYRNDWKMPLIHEVYFNEYNQNNYIWKNKPRTMLRKVVIAQGFRLAFPDELGGMPYDESEIPIEVQETENKPEIKKENDIEAKIKRLKIRFNNELIKKENDKPLWSENEKSSWIDQFLKISNNEAADRIVLLDNLYIELLQANDLKLVNR